ncbi:hypothetical protein Ahy_A05g021904 isoform D [Arachis hypogaea]|uniref:DNA-directed primase/polymerase protein n=1 Tax=Arachis hypogaea TaxID=3818 RepID=A0A445CYW3_ARAHY|nr:hypothetical protein Ahy_A05g021904 isoform D [Arachis hypogaea]
MTGIRKSNNSMEDVDRLFANFKCGLSPPASALRERKRSKSRSENGGLRNDELPSRSPASGGSVGGEQKTPSTCSNATNLQSSIERLKSAAAKAKWFNRGKQLSPIVFYGSPCGVPPKKPIRLWRLLHEIRLDLSQQNKLMLRKEVWATFPRQDEAMKFAKDQEDVHVFSYQDHFNGQRRFLVSTYTEFWRRYKNMDSKFRHHYEVIQEGLPCHLYFDLEFDKRVNIGKDGDEMVDLFILVVLEAFQEKYSIHGNLDWIVELDSSTKEKFSRHLIIRIPKVTFKDNSHAGAFVSEICSRIQNARETDKSFEKLFIMKDSSCNGSTSHLFVDTAVYTRNRCFRLFLSSKAGKNSILLPTGRFKLIYVVDLRRAVYYQKCHDPDCRGYRSPLRQIPVHVFANSSVVRGSEILDDEQTIHNEKEKILQYEEDVDDNCNDSWWLDVVKVAEEIEKQTKTEPSTVKIIDDDDGDVEWWLAVERAASQAELTTSMN